MHDRDTIPAHAEVELQNVDTELDGALERRNRVFGEQPAGAAMSLDLYRLSSHRAEAAEHRDERDIPQ